MSKAKHVCYKCLGKGYLNHYMNIDNGICYTCSGTGEVPYNANTQRKLKYAQESSEKKQLDLRYIELVELEKTLHHKIVNITTHALKNSVELSQVEGMREVTEEFKNVINEKKCIYERIEQLENERRDREKRNM